MSEFQRKTAVGAAWMILARVVDRGLGLVSTLVLARLLVPDDFGLIAMAMSVIALLRIVQAFGLDMALIQHQAPERVHYDTAWTMNVLSSAIVTGILMGIAGPAASFFREPDLEVVMRLLGLIPLIGSLKNIGIVDFRRDLEFDREFRFLLAVRVCRFVPTVVLAFALRNHWALVTGTLVGAWVEVVLSFVVHKYRPRFSLGAWRELWGFSVWLLAKNVGQLLAQRAADFIVGRIVGSRALGLLNVSLEIAQLPSSELAAPINRAVFPGFSREAADPAALRAAFLNVVGAVFIAAVPAGLGLICTAHVAVPLLLGDAWLEAIDLITPLALFGLLNALGSNTGSMFLALGKPRVLSTMAYLNLGLLVPTMYGLVTLYGVGGAAWALAMSSTVVTCISYTLLLRLLSLPLLDMLRRIIRPFVAAGAMVALLRWLTVRLGPATEMLDQLFQAGVLVSVGAVTYVGVVGLLWLLSGRPDGAEQVVTRLVINRLPGRASDA